MKKKILSILALIIILSSVAGCSGNLNETSVSEMPTIEATLKPMPETPTPAPASTATAVPVIENTPSYDYINSLEITKEFAAAKLFVDEWTPSYSFTCGDRKYQHGLGMWIPAKYMKNGEERDTITYALNGMYSKIQFDLFTDSDGAYGTVDKYGSYQIKIYADKQMIYDSKTMYYDGIINDIEIMLPTGANELTIELFQAKGEYGTLDTVLGNFILYHTLEYDAALSANPTPALTSPPYQALTNDSGWVNVGALYLRAKPDFGEKIIDKIPYGYYVSGTVKDYWMHLTWEGNTGWVYIGNLSNGRPCIVDNEDDLEPLD